MLSRQGSITSSASYAHSHPQKIGPWRLGKTLGRGATGRVLLGVHQTTGQKAAVKVVSKLDLNEEYEQPQEAEREGGLPYGIEREIIIMKLLTHPNVLRLYDVWETSKALYLVLEYVEGGELFDLLVERGPLAEQEAVKYFRQIVLGTAYCHALGICHRDLKPENLLLDGALNVKLADFGMAALESNGKLLETSCGLPHYAAPEIVSGLKYHGAASDVWSCGVILFALLTGRLPFDDENIRNLLLKVQAGTFEMPQEISRDAQDLLWRMLNVDPMERITTNDVLAHPLLAKYPCPNEDLISVRLLPHPETAHKSLGSQKNIDPQILENLAILWHRRPQEEIVRALLCEGPTPEKTFYALLLRYRHTQDDATLNPGSPQKRLPRSASVVSARAPQTPRRTRPGQVSASSSRHRPVSFQRRYGARNSVVSSATGSPYKSPTRSPRKRTSIQPGGPLPRDIYHEIMAASSTTSMPPTLPSKDSIYAEAETPATDAALGHREENKDTLAALSAAPMLVKTGGTSNTGNTGNIGTTGGASSKRLSMMKTSGSRMSRRKSVRQSMGAGIKRNSITTKLLSTYAKLAHETDWEYMDKQTKRTSATFGTLCDKIFNHEAYDEEDEKLIDEDEIRAREYERLVELERKKHEAELKARKELAKQQKRQLRRSLFSSSKKLHITVTDDGLAKAEAREITENLPEVLPGKRSQRQAKVDQALRALSEGTPKTNESDLTAADVAALKKRSVTQPIPQRRQTPVLTRRPVSRLDPLWIAHENKELTRAQDALEAEYTDLRKKNNRESMVSVGPATGHTKGHAHRLSKNSDFGDSFELPEHKTSEADLSEEYMSEIRKLRLLNSQFNLNGELNRNSTVIAPAPVPEEKKTLIGSVHIPKVARKSRNFTASNKRLSLLSLKSTKESYQDLNSFLDTHNEDVDEDELNEEEQLSKPGLRTSFADRLDRAGGTSTNLVGEDEEEEVLDAASVIDFDEHVANKRTSYYAGTRPSAASKKGNRKSMVSVKSTLPSTLERDADYTFAEEEQQPGENADDVFESIKLPQPPAHVRPKSTAKAVQPSASSMLLPDVPVAEKPEMIRPPPKNYGQLAPQRASKQQQQQQHQPQKQPQPKTYANANSTKTPLVDSTNLKLKPEEVAQKRNRSIFRKLSWGTKKLLDEPLTQLPSPVDSTNSEHRGGLFLRWFGTASHTPSDVYTYKTILPKPEMTTALVALLGSWSNFGLKDLRRDNYGSNILGSVSKRNTFNFKSCKFRIQVSPRELNQKSQVICVHTKGSAATAKLLFEEIRRVLEKEGVMDA